LSNAQTGIPQLFRVKLKVTGSSIALNESGVRGSPVHFAVYNASGRLIGKRETALSQEHSLQWDCSTMSKGVYMYRVTMPEQTATGTFLIGK
jgi:hypothetical protein